MKAKIKKFNSSTGGYKIDLFLNGAYLCSTDWSKTCKQAKKAYLDKHPNLKGTLSAHFDKY